MAYKLVVTLALLALTVVSAINCDIDNGSVYLGNRVNVTYTNNHDDRFCLCYDIRFVNTEDRDTGLYIKLSDIIPRLADFNYSYMLENTRTGNEGIVSANDYVGVIVPTYKDGNSANWYFQSEEQPGKGC